MKVIAPLCLVAVLAASSVIAADKKDDSKAQPATSKPATSTTKSMIPTDISNNCKSFLTVLNNDAAISSCTAPLLEATNLYTNAKNATSTTSATGLDDSLAKLCQSSGSATTGCSDSLIRQYISDFYGNCTAELQNLNAAVINMYDVLYVLNPFRQAVCTKGESAAYCVLDLATQSTTSAVKRSEDDALERRASTETGAQSNNVSSATDTVESEGINDSQNLPFLFLQPTSPKDSLCSSCAGNIMAAYIQFESSVPYATGLRNSGILGGQSALWTAMKSTCGQAHTDAINVKAGTNVLLSAAGRSFGAQTGIYASLSAAGALLLLSAL